MSMKPLKAFKRLVLALASFLGHSRYRSLKPINHAVSQTQLIIQVLRKLGADLERHLLEYSSSGWTEEFGV